MIGHDFCSRSYIWVWYMSVVVWVLGSLNLRIYQYHLEIELVCLAERHYRLRSPLVHYFGRIPISKSKKMKFFLKRIVQGIFGDVVKILQKVRIPKLRRQHICPPEWWIFSQSSVFFFLLPKAFFFKTVFVEDFSFLVSFGMGNSQSRRSLHPVGLQSSPFHLPSRSIFCFESDGRDGSHCGCPKMIYFINPSISDFRYTKELQYY